MSILGLLEMNGSKSSGVVCLNELGGEPREESDECAGECSEGGDPEVDEAMSKVGRPQTSSLRPNVENACRPSMGERVRST
jgi:hypothetical protein